MLAQAQEKSAHTACEVSKESVVKAKEQLEAHRVTFMSELDRLRGDYEVVDEIIRIF